MSKQIILAVDDSGKFLRYIPKEDGHKGDGIHHLAITVFVFNSKGQVLLQKRKHKVFNNIWENTASTHQLHLSNGHDETDEEATLRALDVEYGIKNIELRNLGGFNYFAKYKQKKRSDSKIHFERIEDLCENEYCKLLVGTYDGEVKSNPEVGYEIKWMEKHEFLKDLEKNPNKYTPWSKVAVKILKEKGVL